MIATWRSGLKLRKSFVLPVLYTRLEDGLQEEWKQEYAHESSLLREVKSRWVDLDGSGDTWVFRRVEKQSKKARGFGIAGDTSVQYKPLLFDTGTRTDLVTSNSSSHAQCKSKPSNMSGKE